MNQMIRRPSLGLAIALAASLAATASGQMEKRTADQYANAVFAKAAPAVNSKAPDLRLRDLTGRMRSLHAERGRTIVLIGASYT